VATPSALILACGALARELRAIVDGLADEEGADETGGDRPITIECLPGALHNHPESIPQAIEDRLDDVGQRYDTILLGYGDCGTGGRIDEICERRNVERLPGPHCYAFYAGQDTFAGLHEEELGTLYLTDYLAKHFDALVWRALGLDRHPELRDLYFGRYRRVMHLAQVDDPSIRRKAEDAAARLGLDFEHRYTGYGELGDAVVELGRRAAEQPA
jgi:hypothetical protein